MTATARWIMIGIISVIGSIGAWQYLARQEATQAEAASVLYESLLSAVREHDVPKAEALEQKVVSEYPKTPYAVLSALLLAPIVPEKTIEYLEVAVRIGAKSPLVHIARVRLAMALAEKGKDSFEEALTLLNSVKPPEAFIRLYEEAKGDIYVQDNQIDKAKTAYAIALQASPADVPTSWLELKKSDLSDISHSKEPS